ncbi:GCG_CRPN prefix-to-repeats domain-containing protein [Variovorax sp. KK3]|uniref:GCG_CRPN prefix-to-repeats domain-containing protein n=1 Tax=Variovorax sp. KK3 TaxID=1855728 RepID=UPI0015C3EDF0|nr:hypothetical protein [Variovorax sp. KK3]
MRTLNKSFKALVAATLAAAALAASAAAPSPVVDVDSAMVVPVAGGCGPNGWRGPWGGCRSTPYYGPLPGGYYQERPVMGNGCPPGYWRGPWGHCRNTPYHGRLPNGGWK